MTYEVDRPIQNSPFAEPAKHWYIQRGRDPKLVDLRRAAFVFGPKNRSEGWDLSDGTLRQYKRDADNTLGTGLNRDESAWIVSSHLNVQPHRRWLVTGRYAAKVAKDQSNGLQSRSITQLVGARSTWDLSDGWDVGLQAYRTWGNGVAETALGIEAGYVVWKNFWLSLGYNIKGFRAPDLAGEAYTQHGIYLRMRLKFDENLLQGASE